MALTTYIRKPRSDHTQEKCIYFAARGFLSDDLATQIEEMVALADVAVRSRDPIGHYLLSWREGEQPTVEQVESAVTIFLDELGLENHQAFYGLHIDTNNLHLHIEVNRVDPETFRPTEINKGYDREAVHRAVARIEHAQGWQRELNGRYIVLENGEVVRAISGEQSRKPDQRKQDMENRTGEKSAVRIAIERGSEILRTAVTWQALHSHLAEQGLRYERVGSGAKIFVGDIAVKASDVDRTASLGQLQKRLGAFDPALQGHSNGDSKLAPQPLIRGVPGWDEYTTARKAHCSAKGAAQLEMRKRHDAERAVAREQQRKRRSSLFEQSWKGYGVARNALQSVLAAEQASERAALRERQKHERGKLRQQFPPFLSLEDWLRSRQQHAVADAWRYRAQLPQEIVGESGDDAEVPAARDIRAYRPQVVGKHVEYMRRNADDLWPGVSVSFTDHGRRIHVHDWQDAESTLAALQLAAEKWGSFSVRGNEEYVALCVRLAAEHGFRIKNLELQDAIARERQRLAVERAYARKSEWQREFEKFAGAVVADRYRVMATRTYADGTKRTFLAGRTREGLTTDEIAGRAREIDRLAARGDVIQCTPLSVDQHHIVVCGMGREQVRQLLADGYRPTVVFESRAGSFQALLTIPKLGAPHDDEVGRRLAEALNRRYGDSTASGSVEICAAAPAARPRYTEVAHCHKASALSRETDAECAAELAKGLADVRIRSIPMDGHLPVNTATEAYRRHHADVMARQPGGKADPSRIDSLIAVRLRVTGHSMADIEAAILFCGLGSRAPEAAAERDWQAYARRTARYAFSAAGNRQMVILGQYRAQLKSLEGGASAALRDEPRLV
ncbi:TraI/MobA(P) family conjugative relaxase [Paraburkholderia ultramafica]|uniref:TraI/MobA(P) family conjugative relaxase n=1 Tax=Paraburkholderia ultramafica TaxID=1544867 RepID=UPI001C2EE096|nr:TraI/MobA(P) family conjugative relaxase [Paraburkholderia ultramafica]